MPAKNTWVWIFFAVATLVVAKILDFAFADIFAMARINNAAVLGENFTLSTLCGALIAVAAGFYLSSLNKQTRSFVEESVVELDKTAWPSREEAWSSTIVVLIFSFISAAILGVFDSVFNWLPNHNLFLY
jgi:preprotein translocase SecE subunit